MTKFDPWKSHHTSISLLPSSRRRIRAALHILERNGIYWSQSELLRRLAKVYLQSWRGIGEKPPVLRRYSRRKRGRKYVIVPWYVDQVLVAALWQRATHSGVSISRMLDFAIRRYLPLMMASWLASPMPKCQRSKRNCEYWRRRLEGRKKVRPDLFISYSGATEHNQRGSLNFADQVKIIPKTGLAPAEILSLIRIAA